MRYIIIPFVLFIFSGCVGTVSKKEFNSLKKEVVVMKRKVEVMRIGVIHQLREQDLFKVQVQKQLKSLFSGVTAVMNTTTRHFKQLYKNDRMLVKIINKLHPKNKDKVKKRKKCTKRKCFPRKK
tara:strand:+ start:264 stop:635 length:372 start_codon:yes stop_codon:yes gene_type:complete